VVILLLTREISSTPDRQRYLEDTWKVTHRLSLVMGVRYLYMTPTYTQGNNMTEFNPFAFNPGLEPTFTAVGGGSILTPSSPGLCSGPLLNVIGTPTYTIECNGLERPGAVPFDQAGRVPVTYVDATLLAAIPATAARGFYNPENLWAPRFGFSFAPFNDKTVIRGGFGIFYDHPEGNALCGGINCQGYVPWSQAVTITALAAGSQSALWQFDAAPAAGTPPALTTQGLNDIDPRLVVARSYQYSLSVQHELPQGMLLQVSFVGNQGRHILRGPRSTTPPGRSRHSYLPRRIPTRTPALLERALRSVAWGALHLPPSRRTRFARSWDTRPLAWRRVMSIPTTMVCR